MASIVFHLSELWHNIEHVATRTCIQALSVSKCAHLTASLASPPDEMQLFPQ